MKLVTYNRDDLVSCAVLTDNGLLDIPAIWPGPNPPRTIIDILQLGPECLEAISSLAIEADTYISLETVKLLAPVPRPGKAIALAFATEGADVAILDIDEPKAEEVVSQIRGLGQRAHFIR